MNAHTKEPAYGAVSRSGSGITFAETEEMAGAFFRPDGGNKGVNRIYARRIVACLKACYGFQTDDLELVPPQGLFHLAAHANQLVDQRDELLAALKDVLHSCRHDFPVGADGEEQFRAAYAEQFTAIASVKGGAA